MDPPQGGWTSINWKKALDVYERVMSLGPRDLRARVECTLELARLCDVVPEDVLSRAIRVLARCLSGDESDSLTPTSRRAIQVAAVHCLTRIARTGNGRLLREIGDSGAIRHMVVMIRSAFSRTDTDAFLVRLVLKCLAVLVHSCNECREVLYEESEVEDICRLFRVDWEGSMPYLVVIMSAMSMLEEFREELVEDGGLPYLVRAASVGSSMASRERACQAIGLLGASGRDRILVNSGAIPVLVDLFRTGEGRAKLVAANALGVISSRVGSIKPAAQAGAIPLYAELLRGPYSIKREIAEDVFSLLAVHESSAVSIAEHAARILRDGDDQAKASAADVLSDIAGYSHSVPAVRNSGAIPILVRLLRDGRPAVREKTSEAIAVLSYSKCDRDALVDAGAIPIIRDSIYGNVASPRIRNNVVEALVHLYEDPDHADNVVEAVGRRSLEIMRERLATIRQVSPVRISLRQMRRLLADPHFV